MATKIGQELVEFSFEQEKTRLDDGTLGYDSKNLDMFTKKVEAYERELKRVFGSLVTTVSQIDQVTGQAVSRMYLPKRYEQEALGVRRAVDLQEFGEQGMNSEQAKNLMYQKSADAVFLETVREIKGAKAQQFAKEAIMEVGGKIIHTPNTANKDMMTSFIPISDAQLSRMGSKDINEYVSNMTLRANSASRAEQLARTKKEKEKEEERLRKERDAQLERDAKRQREMLRENKRKDVKQQRDTERRDEELAKQAEQEEKDKIQSRKQTLGRIGKIITVLGIIADVTRRILTAVLNFASNTSKQQTQANTLNMGLQDVRGFNYLDKALGLDAGTQLQGQEDLRASFGNTANLDTEKLKWLAMVMGNGVVDEVQSGLGGNNPALLMEKIIDAFYTRQQQGVDQYGNQVGQDKARRALVTLLESVSPAIARTFERMIEEQVNGIHAGEITSYRQLQNFYLPATGDLSSADWSMIALLGKETDELKAKFSNLKDLISGDLTKAFKGVIETLDNMHIGMNEEEVFTANKTDYETLVDWRKGYMEYQEGAKGRLADYFASYGALSGMSIEDIVQYAGYETSGTEGAERAKIQSARDAVQALFASPSEYNDLVVYYATKDLIKDITTETTKSNPNALPSRYGDVGYAQARKYAEDLYLGHLGFLRSNELEFTDALFNRPIEDGAVRYYDVVDSKRNYFASGTNEFFSLASALGKKSKYGDALKEVIKKYNKIFGTSHNIDDILKNVGNADYELILRDLFTFGTMYSGLSADTMGIFQGYAKYLPDEYGITPSEWGKIQDAIYETLGKKAYKNSTFESATLTQGSSSGTIDINVNLRDKNGNVQSTKITVQATMEGTANLNKQMELAMD